MQILCSFEPVPGSTNQPLPRFTLEPTRAPVPAAAGTTAGIVLPLVVQPRGIGDGGTPSAAAWPKVLVVIGQRVKTLIVDLLW